jgi:hypothetical protein
MLRWSNVDNFSKSSFISGMGTSLIPANRFDHEQDCTHPASRCPYTLSASVPNSATTFAPGVPNTKSYNFRAIKVEDIGTYTFISPTYPSPPFPGTLHLRPADLTIPLARRLAFPSLLA